MAGIYGSAWSAKYGDAPDGSAAEAWLHVLRVLGPRRIKIALRACLSDQAEFPPTPGRFRKMAEDNDHPSYRNDAKPLALPEKPAQQSVQDEYRTKMRQIAGLEQG